MPLLALGRSCRRETLCSENDAVGPCGKCETVIAVGTPRCSCSKIRSVNAEAFALLTRFGNTSVPLFNRILVGSNSRTSFANALSLVDGDLDVVTSGLGSVMPER